MTIKVFQFYRTRNGGVAFICSYKPYNTYPFYGVILDANKFAGQECWTIDGRHSNVITCGPRDLIREVRRPKPIVIEEKKDGLILRRV
jgi:hypothetical protein